MFKNVKISKDGRTVEFTLGERKETCVCWCPFGCFYIPANFIRRVNDYGRVDVINIAISLDCPFKGIGGRVYLSDYIYHARRHKLICDDLPSEISIIPVVKKFGKIYQLSQL